MDIEEAIEIIKYFKEYGFSMLLMKYGGRREANLKIETAIYTILNELEKKEAIINEMAKQLVEAHGWFYSEFDNFTEKDWIDYFTKKVEGK